MNRMMPLFFQLRGTMVLHQALCERIDAARHSEASTFTRMTSERLGIAQNPNNNQLIMNI